MTELLTAAQMRQLEHDSIQSGTARGLDLMEQAGRGVVKAVFDRWPALAAGPERAVIQCGPGNNGGDGFVIARLLRDLGWDIDLFLLGDADRLPPDAATNLKRWASLGSISGWEPQAVARAVSAGDTALSVDALFGTGLARDIAEDMEPVVQALSRRVLDEGRPAVAVDIPTGLCADSGHVLGRAMAANLTVTFHAAKLGHYLAQGPSCCGALRVVPIGLVPRPVHDAAHLVTGPCEEFAAAKPAGHKFDHGHALVPSGGMGRTGAARLAARGALRIGAGLVTLGVPGAAQMEVACQITALMLRRVDDESDLRDLLRDPRINALCLGPGLGVERAGRLLMPALAMMSADNGTARHCVLDADALTALAQDAEAFDSLSAHCILTPHDGEFARLFPDIAERLGQRTPEGTVFSRLDAARAAAQRAGCHLLLKGPDTIIAGPEGQCSVHGAVYENAAPGLATAGSGDVLAGFITGLLARGRMEPHDAMQTAVWLHAACARAFGPGLIAEDIPEQLPPVLRSLMM